MANHFPTFIQQSCKPVERLCVYKLYAHIYIGLHTAYKEKSRLPLCNLSCHRCARYVYVVRILSGRFYHDRHQLGQQEQLMATSAASVRYSWRHHQARKCLVLSPFPGKDQQDENEEEQHLPNNGQIQDFIVNGNGIKFQGDDGEDGPHPDDSPTEDESPKLCWAGSNWPSISRQLLSAWLPGIKSTTSSTVPGMAPPNSVATNYSVGSTVFHSVSNGGGMLMAETCV